MEHGNNKKLIAPNAVDQREGKSAKQDAAATTRDDAECLRIPNGRSYGSLYSTCEF